MNALTTTNGSSPAVWDNAEKIRGLFAPSLTNEEFQMFIGLGANLGANPFMREIWAIKYGSSPASIFLGRDFYRKKAQEQETYDGHTVDAVYSNDKFEVNNGKPSHSYTPGNRGEIVGAYCTVHLKNTKVPYFVFVEFGEYNTGKSNWAKMPATMIKKVAEAQALRGAFQGVFSGTYSEAEQWIEVEEVKPQPPQRPADLGDAIEALGKCYTSEAVAAVAEKYPHMKENDEFRKAAKAVMKSINNNNDEQPK